MVKKQRQIMLGVLDSSWALQALFPVEDVAEGRVTRKEFKENYGYSVTDAEKALQALVNNLKNDL